MLVLYRGLKFRYRDNVVSSIILGVIFFFLFHCFYGSMFQLYAQANALFPQGLNWSLWSCSVWYEVIWSICSHSVAPQAVNLHVRVKQDNKGNTNTKPQTRQKVGVVQHPQIVLQCVCVCVSNWDELKCWQTSCKHKKHVVVWLNFWECAGIQASTQTCWRSCSGNETITSYRQVLLHNKHHILYLGHFGFLH